MAIWHFLVCFQARANHGVPPTRQTRPGGLLGKAVVPGGQEEAEPTSRTSKSLEAFENYFRVLGRPPGHNEFYASPIWAIEQLRACHMAPMRALLLLWGPHIAQMSQYGDVCFGICCALLRFVEGLLGICVWKTGGKGFREVITSHQHTYMCSNSVCS